LSGIIVRFLRDNNISVYWILEEHPGISDEEVLNIAREQRSILVTEDKDFGEWIFAHRENGVTIIFVRYEKEDLVTIKAYLLNLIEEFSAVQESEQFEFITVNKNKVRRRKL